MNRLALAVASVLVLMPFLWMISLAFTPEQTDAVRKALAAVGRDRVISGRPQVIRIEKN